jgi:hypothetical protein
MKPLLIALLLVGSCAADTCVILKRAANSLHIWEGIEYQYVEGSYPPGFNFNTNLREKHVRKLVKLGGRMVILQAIYSAADLDAARKQCADVPKEKAEK